VPASIGPEIGVPGNLPMTTANASSAVSVRYFVQKDASIPRMKGFMSLTYIIVRVVAFAPKNVPGK